MEPHLYDVNQTVDSSNYIDP